MWQKIKIFEKNQQIDTLPCQIKFFQSERKTMSTYILKYLLVDIKSMYGGRPGQQAYHFLWMICPWN